MPARRPLVRTVCAAAAFAGVVAVAPAATAAPSAPPTGVVTGVVKGVDGRALQGVTVTMARYFAQGAIPPVVTPYASDVTGADGTYRLRVVADGSDDEGPLLLQFRADAATGGTSATGYADRCYGGGSDCLWSSDAGTAFHVVAGRTRSGVDVTLKRAGEIGGRVTDAQGRGVGGFPVTFAVGYAGLVGTPENFETPAESTTTDVNGNYRLPQLPAESGGVCLGTYYGEHAGTPARDGYVSQCAQGVTPAAGRVATRDVAVTGRGAVTGTVVDADGHPVVGAQVTDYRGAVDSVPRYVTTTGADGSFRLATEPGTPNLFVGAGVSVDSPPVRQFRTTSLGRIVLGGPTS